MRHHIFTLLLVVACSATLFSQDCKVPVSFLGRIDEYNFESSYNPNRNYTDYVTRQRQEFFIDSCGFSDDMENTRLAICMNSISETRRLRLRVTLYDTDNNTSIYSVILDSCYEDDDLSYLLHIMHRDLYTGANRQYQRVLDTIRTQIIMLYEAYTPTLIREARHHVAQKNPEMAMFLMAQYPTCCPSYTKVLPFIAATFREYVRNDHSKLLSQAKQAWEKRQSETDARFVVALLNSEELSESNRRKSDKILKKVAKEYPNLDINAHEEYAAIPELAAIAAKLSYKIGVRYSSLHAPETFNYIPQG